MLPEVLDYTMSLPVAFWAAEACGVVMFLEFRRDADDPPQPVTLLMTFARDGGRWSPHRWIGGMGWAHDPVADPGSMRDLGGQMMTQSGGSCSQAPEPGHPAVMVVGRVAPAVGYISLIQDGREDRRPLNSHFGAWVVCTEHWSPYQVNALDNHGAVLGYISGPPCGPSRG